MCILFTFRFNSALSVTPATPFEYYRDRLRYARDRAQLSNAKLARAVNVTSASIGNMLSRDGKTYRGPQLEALAEVLKVPTAWLGFNEGEPPHDAFPPGVAKTPVGEASDLRAADSLTTGLSSLQCAVLEKMATLMRAQAFSDEEAISLLAKLQPRLALVSAPKD